MSNSSWYVYIKYPKILTAVILSFATIWLVSSFGTTWYAQPHSKALPVEPVAFDGTIKSQPHGLRNLSSNVQIASIHIQAIVSNTNHGLVTDIQRDLPPFQSWDVSSNETLSPADVAVLVPAIAPRADASSIMFGVATTIRRLDESLDTFAHWASGTGTTIVAILPDDDNADDKSESPRPNQHHVQQRARDLNINLHIERGSNDFIQRYVSMLQILHKYTKPQTNWVALIDDDTFFPSISRLTSTLETYDASKPHYLGGLSENLDAAKIWGFIAFGGAGIFLSKPLLDELQPFIPRCMREGVNNGDGKVARCINRYTTTKFSPVNGLHQIDLRGDPAGFYEAVRPLPISVHHYKSFWKLNMALASTVSAIVGEAQVFAKYHFGNGWWMTNGFSVVKYSRETFQTDDQEVLEWFPPVSHRNGAMEKTFWITGETPEKFAHSLTPLAPKDEGKIQYMLEAAISEANDALSLYYVRRVDGLGEGVIRVIWSTMVQDNQTPSG